MLSPRSHPLIIILHSHYLFILSTVAPSPCLGSCCLALVCCPLSIVSFPLISHAFHLVPYHFVLASAFFDHVLSVMGSYFLTLLLLGCTAGLIQKMPANVFLKPGVLSPPVQVKRTSLVGTLGSDHLPLVVDFGLVTPIRKRAVSVPVAVNASVCEGELLRPNVDVLKALQQLESQVSNLTFHLAQSQPVQCPERPGSLRLYLFASTCTSILMALSVMQLGCDVFYDLALLVKAFFEKCECSHQVVFGDARGIVEELCLGCHHDLSGRSKLATFRSEPFALGPPSKDWRWRKKA